MINHTLNRYDTLIKSTILQNYNRLTDVDIIRCKQDYIELGKNQLDFVIYLKQIKYHPFIFWMIDFEDINVNPIALFYTFQIIYIYFALQTIVELRHSILFTIHGINHLSIYLSIPKEFQLPPYKLIYLSIKVVGICNWIQIIIKNILTQFKWID